MKSLLSIFFTVYFLNLNAQNILETHFISRTSFVSDIHFMTNTLEQIQVDAYKMITKNSLHKKLDSIIARLDDSISNKQAFIITNQIAALYNDGHIYIDDNDEVSKGFEASNIFPLNLALDKSDNLIVIENFSTSKKIKSSDKILSINGQSVKKIYDKALALQGGLINYRINEINKYLSYDLYLLDIKPPYLIAYKSKNLPKKLYDTLQGINYIEFRRSTRKKKQPNYSYQILENNIAYLNFVAMQGSIEKFTIFLDSCFTEFKAKKVRGLIVDLRYNAGGNSELGEVLLSYLTDKPYSLSIGRDFKVSNQYQMQMQGEKDDWLPDEYNRYQKATIGTTIYFKYGAKNRIPNNKKRYPIKTYFLIGAGNFSSATMLADGAQTYKLATLIGQPTGAPANGSGEVYTFELPYTRFKINAPVTFDIRANGNKVGNNPVMPDIFVRPNPIRNVDLELNKAIEYIIKK